MKSVSESFRCRAGSKDWTTSGPWTITGAGTHTIRWKFIKDSSGSSGSDCLWIDRIRWTGAMPDGEGWDRIEYAYDPAGRRIEKKVDGTTQVKYVYDGDHILAEYNNAGTLLRKYVHGPCVDQPICMIEASGTYAGTHYYHYDALGSCVAMTNSAGNVTQLYEYSVYGQVAASDASHPNRFMFTGREFDKDTGLYYYRARYYNPEIGRFLQTDPIGYGDGLNWYAYCLNNPMNAIDAFGTIALTLIQATGRLAISQGNTNDPVLTGGTVATNWTQLMGAGLEAWGKAADVKGYLYDAGKEVAFKTLESLVSNVASRVIGAAQAVAAPTTVHKVWRAFIEVKDYNDTNGNRKVDPDDWESLKYKQEDLWSKPRWVELQCVHPIGTPKNPTGGTESFWADGGGYLSAEAALGACQRAIVSLTVPGVVSEALDGRYPKGGAPFKEVNWPTELQLSFADMTAEFLTYISDLVVMPGGTN